jgi:hypothetical protein
MMLVHASDRRNSTGRPRRVTVRISSIVLTVEKKLPRDFKLELIKFRKQVSHIAIEIRTTAAFHDRFIVIDNREFYHVGASIKDAGKRAFMISRIEDQQNLGSIRETIRSEWESGTAL